MLSMIWRKLESAKSAPILDTMEDCTAPLQIQGGTSRTTRNWSTWQRSSRHSGCGNHPKQGIVGLCFREWTNGPFSELPSWLLVLPAWVTWPYNEASKQGRWFGFRRQFARWWPVMRIVFDGATQLLGVNNLGGFICQQDCDIQTAVSSSNHIQLSVEKWLFHLGDIVFSMPVCDVLLVTAVQYLLKLQSGIRWVTYCSMQHSIHVFFCRNQNMCTWIPLYIPFFFFFWHTDYFSQSAAKWTSCFRNPSPGLSIRYKWDFIADRTLNTFQIGILCFLMGEFKGVYK